MFSSNSALRSRTYTANIEVEKPNGKMQKFTVEFFIDRWGKARLLEEKKLPLIVKEKYRGTLLEGILSQTDYTVVKDPLGYRLKRNGEEGALEYEFEIRKPDAQSGIPFHLRRLSQTREYGDLRNIGLSPELNGATIVIKVHSEHADLRNSSYKEIKHVFRKYDLYNRDGSETLVYNTRTDLLPRVYLRDYGEGFQKWLFWQTLQGQPQKQFTGFQIPNFARREHFSSMMPIGENAQLSVPSAFGAAGAHVANAGAFEASFGADRGRFGGDFGGYESDSSSGSSGWQDEESSDEQSKGRGKKLKPIPLSSLADFKAVIFDLDGVVVDSEAAHLRSFNQLLAQFGVKITEKMWRENYTGVGSLAILKDVFAKNGIKEDVGAWMAKRAEIYHDVVVKTGLKEIAGFSQFFKLLEQNGIKAAVASGGHRPHILASMMSIGMPRVEFVGLEDVKNAKPAPETFLLAANKLGVSPSQCVVFEDSFAGMKAAASAGMPCIALSTTLPASAIKGKAALVVNNFASPALRREIKKLIAKNGGKKREKEKAKTPGWLYPVKCKANAGRSAKPKAKAGKRKKRKNAGKKRKAVVANKKAGRKAKATLRKTKKQERSQFR
ncbi:MAG: HAD family phosphatase [Candidatus Micrarchaeia archaeon]